VIERKLADCILMEVKGPLDLYGLLLQQPVDPAEAEKSINMVSGYNEHLFVTTIAPIVRHPGDPTNISCLTPEEVADAAKLIKTASGETDSHAG
jgi:hypothetical protein